MVHEGEVVDRREGLGPASGDKIAFDANQTARLHVRLFRHLDGRKGEGEDHAGLRFSVDQISCLQRPTSGLRSRL